MTLRHRPVVPCRVCLGRVCIADRPWSSEVPCSCRTGEVLSSFGSLKGLPLHSLHDLHPRPGNDTCYYFHFVCFYSILGPLLFNLYILPLGHTKKYILKNIYIFFICISRRGPIVATAAALTILCRGKHCTAILDSKGLKVKQVVKILSVYIDSDLHLNCHIKSTTKSEFCHLRNIAKLRNFKAKNLKSY